MPWIATVVAPGTQPHALAAPKHACATPYPPITSPSRPPGTGVASPARTRRSVRSGSAALLIAAW